MLETLSLTNLIAEFEYLTVDFKLNLTRPRLGLDLRACKFHGIRLFGLAF